MILECPYCSTRFRLDEAALGARRPTLRFSQCSRTFTLPPPPETDDDDDLALTYDDGPDPAEDELATPVERRSDEEQLAFPMDRDDDEEPQRSLFGDEIDDYGSALVGTGTIDLFKPTLGLMNEWGVRHVDIQILKWGSWEKSAAILSKRCKYAHCRCMYQNLQSKVKRQSSNPDKLCLLCKKQ